jgi:type IV secretion system protein VirD4
MRHLEQPGPGAGFATRNEMLPFVWTPESFYFGRTAPEIAGNPSLDIGMPKDDDRAVFLTAGSRGGKSTGIIVNNLIGWPGGVVALDPKGELASLTAMRRGKRAVARGSGTSVRHFLEQNVAVLDPMGVVIGPARLYEQDYNPLFDLDPESPGYVGELRNVARAVVIEETSGNARHFTEMAVILIAGVLQVVMMKEPVYDRNLVTARNIMIEGRTEEYLKQAPHEELAKEALGAMEIVTGTEASGFHTTLVRQWAWLADPRMQHHMQTPTSFSLKHIVQDGGTVYICMPFEELDEQNRWMRLMLTMALRAKLQMGAIRTS